MSSPFTATDGYHGVFGTFGWGVNFYPPFLFDLLASIRGTRTERASSLYGLDFERTCGSRLFTVRKDR
jgi:hypothetical protein